MGFVISEYTSAKLPVSNILSDYSIVWHNKTAIKQVVKITAQSSITKNIFVVSSFSGKGFSKILTL